MQVELRNGQPYIWYAGGLGKRDKFGMLWQAEGETRGGKPLFSEVSCYRQRASMLGKICQVCGGKIDVSAGYFDWLVPKALLNVSNGELITTSPPTCAKCIKIALAVCPHLKANDWELVRVSAYTVWGVTGDIMVRHKKGVRRREGCTYQYGQRNPIAPPSAVIAKQQVVVWQRYDFIEMSNDS